MLILHIPMKEYKNITKMKIDSLVKEIENLSYRSNKTTVDGDVHLYLNGDKITAEPTPDISLIAMEKEIIDAIVYDRVMIMLQPIWSVEKKCFSSAEVLTRLVREDGSLIMPGDFIPVAEDLGIIADLEDVIIKKTCEFLKQINLEAFGLDYIEVNLSVKNGENIEFAKNYLKTLAAYEIEPKFLNFEITETATLIEKEHLIENMNAMINEGCHFSLDDFGSGESNLNYIIDMPIRLVKFDKAIADAVRDKKRAKTIMRLAIQMAHELGLKTVAEGIEEEEMVNVMKDMGIDYIQGYYFSKPLEQSAFLQFIREKNGL